MDKIVFLDVDGVLCPYPIWQASWIGNENSRLDPVCCDNLRKILDETGAKVVLTTSWRLCRENLERLLFKLAQNAIPYELILGQTADLNYDLTITSPAERRYLEISDYVIRNNADNYIILDDFDLNKYDKKHFVRTGRYKGLTVKQTNACIKKLNAAACIC
jgi:hypothetical protein